MTGTVFYGKEQYSFAQISRGDLPELSAHEDLEEALLFCQQWLQGAGQFTLQTSGSTGEPKPITVTRELMALSAARTIKAVDLLAGQHALLCLPTRFIAGKMMLVRAMEANMDISIVPPAGNPLRNWESDRPIDFTALIPMQMEQILQEATTREKLTAIDKIILGGGATSEALKRALQDIPSQVYATYGMTETVSHIALQKLNGPDKQESFEALGELTLSQDERDCLIISGYGGPDLITNDRVELLDQRHFKWLGRADFVINSGGIKMQPELLEAKAANALKAHLTDRQWLIAARPQQQLGEELVLVIEGHAFGEAEEAAINEALKKALSRFEQPRAIVYLAVLPQTPTGKLKRAEISQLLSAGKGQ